MIVAVPGVACPHGVVDGVCWLCDGWHPEHAAIASYWCFGTWQRFYGEGEPGNRDHIQRLFEAFPEPRGSSDGVGEEGGWWERVMGGVAGWGVERQARDVVDWLRRNPARLRVLGGHSRGAQVVALALRRLQAIRDACKAQGKTPPTWTKVDVVILLDLVNSTGLSGALKYAGWAIDKVVPGSERFAGWVERHYELPEACGWCLAIYAEDERRPGFRHTMVRLPEDADPARLVAGVMSGRHAEIGGYGDLELGRMVGSLIRQQVAPKLGQAGVLVSWRETWREDLPFEVGDANPPPRGRLFPGTPAWRPRTTL